AIDGRPSGAQNGRAQHNLARSTLMDQPMSKLHRAIVPAVLLLPMSLVGAEDLPRRDSAAVKRVLFLKQLNDPHRRNQRLLEWVDDHRHEFGSVNPERGGWGDLETDIFDWIMASGIPEDCWAAVRLYAELNHGAVPPLKSPAFGSREGRDFLLQIVLNEKALI